MDPQHAFVNGLGARLSDSNGNPWSVNFIISSGDLLADMRFNVVCESQDRLQVSRNFLQTEDKGVRDMLSYLMARETQHQLQFLKACEELEEKYGPVVSHDTQDLQKQGKEFTHTLTTSHKEKPLKHSKKKLPVMETNPTIVVTPLWQLVILI